MLASTLVVGFAALLMLALGVLNPVLALIVVALALIPLALILAGGLFKHASAIVPKQGPSVPSSAEASYDPVTDPSRRG